MRKCKCCESRKNRLYGAWLNPKRLYNRQSAAKPRTEERPTTIPEGSRLQAIGSRSGRHPQG